MRVLGLDSEIALQRVATALLEQKHEWELQHKRDTIGAELVFDGARKKYLAALNMKLVGKQSQVLGDGFITADSKTFDAFKSIQQAALSILGAKNAMDAYKAGKGQDANYLAERICAAVIGE
jgi:hypothetical protein